MKHCFSYFCLVAVGVASLGHAQQQHRPNLLELAKQLNLTKFVEALQETKMDHVVNHEGPFTIFAPTDEAFAHEKFYPGETSLKDKIRFHIGRGLVKANDIQNEQQMKSLLSKRTVRLNKYENGKVSANGRQILSTDHEAFNGIIHTISDVMSSVYHRSGSVISELNECCPQHSTLLELVNYAGLFHTLDNTGPYTFMAPLNVGFEHLHPDFILHLKKNVTALRLFLLTHVVPGTLYSVGMQDGQTVKTASGTKFNIHLGQNGTVMFGKATVSLSDVTAGNGVIHSIDEVLFPKKQLGLYPNDDDKNEKQPMKKTTGPDLVQVLDQMGRTSFARALVETKLDQVLREKGHYTIFAPPNESFDASSSSTSSLSDRVRAHIARGLVKPTKMRDGIRRMSMLHRRFINFKVMKDDIILANGQQVVPPPHAATNGLVYPIKASMDLSKNYNGA